ncbi:MAG: YidH family protein [Francisellaceae bacterium]
MIQSFNDHAANERTYLAWVRTAIALMAFGFLIEKFDIFLRVMAKGVGMKTQNFMSHSAEAIGIVLMVIAATIIIVSSIRFAINRRLIASQTVCHYNTRFPDIFLGVLLTTITIFMVIYAVYVLS